MNNVKSPHPIHRGPRNGWLTFAIDMLAETASIIGRSIMIMPAGTLFCVTVLFCITPEQTLSNLISGWHSMTMNDRVAIIKTVLQYVIFSSLLGVLTQRLRTGFSRF